eukprot:symbB.v1.2.003410.t1/scaffold185.1/size279819/5
MAFAASGHESWQRPEADPPSLGIFLDTKLQARAEGWSKLKLPPAWVRRQAPVISILVLKVGILGSRSTLDQLAGCLGDPNANTVEGSFNALNKICEDGMMLIKQTWDYPDQETQHFVSWSAENLLPKVMQFPKHRFCS